MNQIRDVGNVVSDISRELKTIDEQILELEEKRRQRRDQLADTVKQYSEMLEDKLAETKLNLAKSKVEHNKIQMELSISELEQSLKEQNMFKANSDYFKAIRNTKNVEMINKLNDVRKMAKKDLELAEINKIKAKKMFENSRRTLNTHKAVFTDLSEKFSEHFKVAVSDLANGFNLQYFNHDDKKYDRMSESMTAAIENVKSQVNKVKKLPEMTIEFKSNDNKDFSSHIGTINSAREIMDALIIKDPEIKDVQIFAVQDIDYNTHSWVYDGKEILKKRINKEKKKRRRI